MESTLFGRQYETMEFSFPGAEPCGSQVEIDLAGEFACGGEIRRVKGFYAGGGVYKLRFLPEQAGTYTYRIEGAALAAPVEGSFEAAPAAEGEHGIVRPDGIHLRFADGRHFFSFGTTVYALAHQSDALIEETLDTLSKAPFNKIRICVFPKHYRYNSNNPAHYAFLPKAGVPVQDFDASKSPAFPQKKEKRDAYWDVHHPDFAFWDAFEKRLMQLKALGIQVDLILFHPYDRWGFSNLRQEDNLVYLDYLLRRLAAYPHLWWSLSNEYDLSMNKTVADWEGIECFVAANDPYHHLLGNHNCFQYWDPARENITHVSWQTRLLFRVVEMQRRYGKPVLIDECRYEGNVPEFWGNLSGQDMTRAFWKVTVQGGYCTHGETFLPGTEMGARATRTGEEDVVWWAKGGLLNGESIARIAFLRGICEELPGPLTSFGSESGGASGNPFEGMCYKLGLSDEEYDAQAQQAPEFARGFLTTVGVMRQRERDFFFSSEFEYGGHCGEDAFLYYKDDQCCAAAELNLPEGKRYRVEVIDTWDMTRTVAAEGVSGHIEVKLPGKPYMAILCVKE